MNTVISNTNPPKKFSDINGESLKHPQNKVPFRSLLSFHAQCANKSVKDKKWINEADFSTFETFHQLSEGATITDINFDC